MTKVNYDTMSGMSGPRGSDMGSNLLFSGIDMMWDIELVPNKVRRGLRSSQGGYIGFVP